MIYLPDVCQSYTTMIIDWSINYNLGLYLIYYFNYKGFLCYLPNSYKDLQVFVIFWISCFSYLLLSPRLQGYFHFLYLLRDGYFVKVGYF